MALEKFEKWDSHVIGNTPWVKKHNNHIHRYVFTDYILNSNIKSILEVGGGELVEAKHILRRKPDMDYSVVDVSDTFLDYCNSLKLGIKTHKASMHELPFDNKQFDLIYISSVLEHSPDIVKTIEETARVSKEFFFVMFKWKEKTGSLKSDWKDKKGGYFSTYFNLPSLIKEIQKHGNIKNKYVCKPNSQIDYKIYKDKIIKDADKWRNGDRLIIAGEWD